MFKVAISALIESKLGPTTMWCVDRRGGGGWVLILVLLGAALGVQLGVALAMGVEVGVALRLAILTVKAT